MAEDQTEDSLGGWRAVGGGRVWSYAYDGRGRLASTTDPLGQQTGFVYDSADRVTQQTLPNGLAIGFSYDSSGNVTAVTPPGRPAHEFHYTPVDLVDTAMPPPLVSGATPTTYAYNQDQQITQITRADSTIVSFGYDLDGLLTAAGALGLKRDSATGLPERDSLGTVKGVWNFDSSGVLADYTSTNGATTLFQTGYVRDSLLRITQLTETIQGAVSNTLFSYDSVGRLTQVRRNGILAATYEYDSNGNRTRLTTPNGVVTGSYLVANWIKNQPWNFSPMPSRSFHVSVHGKGPNAFTNPASRLWNGSPDWAKAAAAWMAGNAANAAREDNDCGC